MKDTAHEHTTDSHGSLKSYLIGFILSIILTVIPFAMVMSGIADRSTILLTILIFAVVQIVVHVFYFLHINGSSEQRSNLNSFIFTLVIVAIVIGGSVWIMHNLNSNMVL